MQAATKRQLVGVASLMGLAIAAALVFSPETVIAELEGLAADPLVFVAVITGIYLIRPFLLWPATLVAVVLGYLYGPVIGIPVAVLGGMVTATPPYLIGRYARTDLGLFGTVSASGERLVGVVGETRSVLAARLSPIPGDPISYGAGISAVSPRSFYLATGIGEIPWAAVGVFTGASLSALSLSEFAVSLELVIVFAGFSAIVLSGPVYNHIRDPGTHA